jgi:1-acyl-sn-glycerol-3-phosphate acyltransferase
MITLRSIIYFITMVISTIFFGLAMSTIGLLFPLSVRDWLSQAWANSNLWLMRIICGLKYRIKGTENLPQSAAIIMSKHQSSWETISLKGLLFRQQSWILKRELMWIPIFGWALASIPTIAINRNAGRQALKQIIKQGKKVLDDGRIVVVFPEGTRTAPGEKRKYAIGGAMLAEKSGYPVIPIAHNAGIFWKRRDLKKYPGTIDVVVGAPIETKGKKAGEINRIVETWIEDQVAKLPTNTLGN